MRCDEIREVIPAFAQKEVNGEERIRIRNHLILKNDSAGCGTRYRCQNVAGVTRPDRHGCLRRFLRSPLHDSPCIVQS